MQVETFGSIVMLDESEMMYLRVPKTEGPRLPGPHGEDWGGPNASPGLRDLVWHPYLSWHLRPGYFWPDRLVIAIPEPEGFCTSFPIADDEYARLLDLVDA